MALEVGCKTLGRFFCWIDDLYGFPVEFFPGFCDLVLDDRVVRTAEYERINIWREFTQVNIEEFSDGYFIVRICFDEVDESGCRNFLDLNSWIEKLDALTIYSCPYCGFCCKNPNLSASCFEYLFCTRNGNAEDLFPAADRIYLLLEMADCIGCTGIAGDDDDTCSFIEEKFHTSFRERGDLFTWLISVGTVCTVTEEYHIKIRELLSEGFHYFKSTDSRIKETKHVISVV